jgi:general secretion pathway protein D
VQTGTGTFVHKVLPPQVDTTPGDITLNFDGTDIREVVKVILGDLLHTNYVLSPAVHGVASLQTGRPLRRQDLIPTLETLLRMNGAALVYTNGQYEVVPVANAVQGKLVPQLGETTEALPDGYSLEVVPLRYIGAEDMANILKPLAPEGSIIRVDTLRNLLVIAGTSPEMSNLLDTVRVFDVDWMAGLSVGFYTLEYAKAKDVASQLQNLLAEGGGKEGGNPLTGIFRFIPIESANSLLVISPQAKYLKDAKTWIERLDLAEASGSAAERLFVYRVKYGSAEEMAQTLSGLFGKGGVTTTGKVGGVAPGLRPASMESGGGSKEGGLPTQKTSTTGPVSSQLELSSPVSIVADTVNNALLVRSTPRDYKLILDAIKQIDLVPLQVLVEATIVEITLTGELQYGIQWRSFASTSGYRSATSLTQGTTVGSDNVATLSPSLPGFNWTLIARPTTIEANLNALASEGLVHVLSSPALMVMDNQTAKIQVGQQVPVQTASQQSIVGQSNVVNSIQYKDTGVILQVKPRVTPGGLVQMEIDQKVLTVANTGTTGGIQSPTFSTRTIMSDVAVRSGQAVVLGGLIEDTRTNTKTGVPGLSSVPILGWLFSERDNKANRRELVVVLTPRVIASDRDVQEVTQDFRTKLKGLEYRF